MANGPTQAERTLRIETPLGDDALLLESFQGREALSRPFAFELELLSTHESIEPAQIVGKDVTFSLYGSGSEARHFHGRVARLVAGSLSDRGMRRYRARVVPRLWFLGKRADCRIFQDQDVKQIAEKVLSDAGVRELDTSGIKGRHPKWTYRVQWNESDLDFLSRLLEEEGVFYTFRHERGKHTLVLADSTTAYAKCDQDRAEYEVGPGVLDQITRWDHGWEYVSGKWAEADYNHETPSTALSESCDTVLSLPEIGDHARFEYPGGFGKRDEGRERVKLRMEENEAAHDVVEGESGYASFYPGAKFTLSAHPVRDEQGKGFVLTEVEHRGSEQSLGGGAGGAPYSNSFRCIPDSAPFRPPRRTPRPRVHGPQTAVVAGPSGEELHTDEHGRIKVRFHWDREQRKDEDRTCWIRVQQSVAGDGWGAIALPRVGQEVIVQFIDGDPDQPIVTGGVYHAELPPPYDLPGARTRSTFKSRSFGDSSNSKFNELRIEDKKDEEELYVHAQKDFLREVENDDRLEVRHDQEIEVENDRTLTVKDGKYDVLLEKGDLSLTVDKGTRKVEIDGDTSLEVRKGDHSVKVQRGDQTTKVTAGKITIQAGKSIELKVGASKIKIDNKGIKISGMKLQLDGTAQVQVGAPQVKIEGDAMASVGAPIAKIQADGVLMLKGSLTKIN